MNHQEGTFSLLKAAVSFDRNNLRDFAVMTGIAMDFVTLNVSPNPYSVEITQEEFDFLKKMIERIKTLRDGNS